MIMFNSNKKIIITAIQGVEEILKENRNHLTPELQEKMESIIYNGYEILSKMISDNIQKEDKNILSKIIYKN